MKAFIFATMLLLGANVASAQGVSYPGSMWSVNGTASVAEPGNYITRTHAEQGIALRGYSLVLETSLVGDKLAYDWNRSALLGILARYTINVGGGVIRLNAGYETEKRYVSARVASGFVYSADCWFGWRLR